MPTVEERNAWLFFSLLQAKAGSSLVSRLGDLSPVEAVNLSSQEFARVVRAGDNVRAHFSRLKAAFDPDSLLADLARKGISLVTLTDTEYPERLRETSDPPPALFVSGELPGQTDVLVALVGSRKASVSGLDVAQRLGRKLAERDVCVVSGLALGIDAAAHRGSLSGGGATVGVLGCGIDIVYPKQHYELFDEVKERGAIVSEYCLGEAPLTWRFPARNRIIAGLCETVVVVEAAEKSGALITARHALDAGRDVWAAPGPPGASECRGSNKLLADGAGVLWDVEEFVESVAPEMQAPENLREGSEDRHEVPAGLPPAESAALSGVGFEPVGADVVAARSGVAMRELLSALTMLELKGYVARDSGGAFVRRTVS